MTTTIPSIAATGLAAAVTDADGTRVEALGALTADTTLYLPVTGADAARVVALPTTKDTGGGAVTATVTPCLPDDATPDPSFSPVVLTLTANTATTASITGFGGARMLALALTIPDGSALSFEGGTLAYFAHAFAPQSGLVGAGDASAANQNTQITAEQAIQDAIGATTDAAVSTDAVGSVSAKLRGLVKILADVYVSASHWLKVQLQAGENHVGAVGGHTASVAPTVTVTAGLYAAGDCVGGLLTLTGALRTNAAGARWHALVVTDAANVAPELDVLLFNASPSASTFTDHAPAVLDAADAAKVVRRAAVLTAHYTTIGGVAVADVALSDRVVRAASGTTLYAALVARGTPTFAATTDEAARFDFVQD